jgi:hypothetical protein
MKRKYEILIIAGLFTIVVLPLILAKLDLFSQFDYKEKIFSCAFIIFLVTHSTNLGILFRKLYFNILWILLIIAFSLLYYKISNSWIILLTSYLYYQVLRYIFIRNKGVEPNPIFLRLEKEKLSREDNKYKLSDDGLFSILSFVGGMMILILIAIITR